jgi:hypothetical protein
LRCQAQKISESKSNVAVSIKDKVTEPKTAFKQKSEQNKEEEHFLRNLLSARPGAGSQRSVVPQPQDTEDAIPAGEAPMAVDPKAATAKIVRDIVFVTSEVRAPGVAQFDRPAASRAFEQH